MPPLIKTLIVEDHADFRAMLCLILQESTQCQIIGIALDGVDAVQKAEELQPDLILLDLGLPKLNGIEVTRRIRKLSARSKVLIISQDSSPEMVEGALRAGAHGYLLKSDATEVSLAVDAVLQHSPFVSSSLERNPGLNRRAEHDR
jgi:DNA-binding NarL/FixJ family response regulator